MHCEANAIELHNVSYRYPDGTQALDDVSVTLRHEQRVALLGPNGAGKSTLIAHLNGIITAQTGAVLVEDVPLTQQTIATVRQRIGIVFQDPDNMLFMTSIEGDIAFGPRNLGLPESEVSERVARAVAATGLEGLEGKPGMHLSFGQKKRAAIAAVLACAPAVLVLDEPTSNLDPRGRREMLDFLRALDVTLLVATHDLEAAWELCDRALVIDEGRLVADGDARAILADRELMLGHGLDVPFLARSYRA
ncbi:MAG: energy-coupling factor ABC transporter ATP-binding protein [Actinomycetia bacterium]|nr:energy-coupling factor ABC transporter ATP-binding protein [Actinomycetes bacterium]